MVGRAERRCQCACSVANPNKLTGPKEQRLRSKALLLGLWLLEDHTRIDWASDAPQQARAPEEVACDIDSVFKTCESLSECVGDRAFELVPTALHQSYVLTSNNHIHMAFTSQDDDGEPVETMVKLSNIPNTLLCEYGGMFHVNVFFPSCIERTERGHFKQFLPDSVLKRFWSGVVVPAARTTQSRAALQRLPLDAGLYGKYHRTSTGQYSKKSAGADMGSSGTFSDEMRRIVAEDPSCRDFKKFFFHAYVKGCKDVYRSRIYLHNGSPRWVGDNPYTKFKNEQLRFSGRKDGANKVDYVDVGWEIVPAAGYVYLWDVVRLREYLRRLKFSTSPDIFFLSGRLGGVTGTPMATCKWRDRIIYLNIYLVLKDLTYVHKSLNATYKVRIRRRSV